ncbi:alcohol dehydrogenase-like protein [Xylogone sp. PMI_703]|nr:alcohol dehydrogenase-like protein [Xylogone sp. PMI_703]
MDPIPPTMKAQRLHAFHTPYSLDEIPTPTPTGYQILVRVGAASYCHTDLVYASGEMSQSAPLPLIPCHEFAGTIVGAGDLALSSVSPPLKVGARVGIPGRSFQPCGKCWECTHNNGDPRGYSVYCSNSKNNGITRDGGFCEYAVVDARQVAVLPDQLSDVDAAPLMCAGLTIYAALLKCELGKGDRGKKVGIIGAGGGLGHLGLQFAMKKGYDVIGVDASDKALELATGLNTGAKIFDARKTPAESLLNEIGEGGKEKGEGGLDAVLILPENQAGFDYGMKLLKNHGLCVVVSFPKAGFRVSAEDLVFRHIQVVGSLIGPNKVLREMLTFAAEHDVKAVKKTFSLTALNDLVEEYKKMNGGKLVVDMKLK